MNGPATTAAASLEVADIVRAHGQELLARHRTSPVQRRVLRDLVRCRTAELGGHVERCDRCPHERIAYNSCRNRHCPKCQGSVAARWMQERAGELLDVPYFHVVFTLPDGVAELARYNPRLVYGMLFRAASRTLLEVAADPRHLGAQIGFLAVLHTWGQNLHHHQHVHCVVPAGGLSPCGTRWISGREDFFLPVRVLSRVFRGKFIALLQQAWQAGRLQLPGPLAQLADAGAWQHWLNVAVRQEWVVYAKRPFGGPEVVLKYLARYTHRVAISNRRLIRLEDGRVTFGIRDYAAGGGRSTCTLTAVEFLRRFLQHVLPRGFVRIRHFGYMANRCRRELLHRCRALRGLEQRPPQPPPEPEPPVCPVCRTGRIHITPVLRRDRPHAGFPRRPFRPPILCDTS